MFKLSITSAYFCIAIVLVSFTPPLFAAQFIVSPKDDLQKILDNAHDGDVVLLDSGVYLGNFTINHQITLRGKQGAIINAQGKDHALTLTNSNITLEYLNIINWGDDLTEQNSGIYSNKKIANKRVTGLIIQHNTLSGNGFGIWLNHVDNAKVLFNKVTGNTSLRSADRGNGIQISNVTNTHVFNNEVSKTRDGIYVISSQNNILEKNTMHDLRYGIHYMYSYDNSVLHNKAYNTRAGYALMSSRRLIIDGNTTRDSEDYGFLLNFITKSTFTNNHIKNVWTKPEHKVIGREGKGLFVYNSGYNTLESNTVDTAEIGIHLTAGSENIKIYGNSFINNPTQVKYVSNKKQEWSKDGRGNYWSNYLGWDMNNDGVGDTVFEPNDGIDKLVWQYPEMKMIMDSPAILILRWVQKQFPVLKPPGIKDSYPLMESPHIATFSQQNQIESKTLVKE
jgi:nitrous oxidase accessory protein